MHPNVVLDEIHHPIPAFILFPDALFPPIGVYDRAVMTDNPQNTPVFTILNSRLSKTHLERRINDAVPRRS